MNTAVRSEAWDAATSENDEQIRKLDTNPGKPSVAWLLLMMGRPRSQATKEKLTAMHPIPGQTHSNRDFLVTDNRTFDSCRWGA